MFKDVPLRLSVRAAALFATIVLAAGFLALYVVAVRTYTGQSVDVILFSWWADLLDRPYLGDLAYAENTFPSGHVAATAALAVALTLLASRSARPLAAVAGAAVAVVAAPASVVSHAHRPSDVAASLLLVAAVTCLVGAFALPDAGRRRLRLPGQEER